MTSPQTQAVGVGDGEAPAPTVCSYASCTKPGPKVDTAFPDWAFCKQHWLEHRADMYGEKWPHIPVERVLLPLPCGTVAAARRHRRNGERVCERCLEAQRVAGPRVGRGYQPRTRTAECGTYSGYARHRDRSEKPCEPCRLAKQAYDRQRYVERTQVVA